MPVDIDRWDPPEKVEVDYSNQPAMSDLVNSVIALLGPGEPEMVPTEYGERERVRFDHLVVFNSQGGIADVFEDYAIFQASLLPQVKGRPVTVGKLRRPGQGYELLKMTKPIKEKVRDALFAANLLTDDDGLPDKHERRVKAEAKTRQVVDDDAGF